MLSISAHARKLAPIEIYKRCNIHLSGQPISITGETEKKIKLGQLDPIKECEKILKMGFLKDDGLLATDNQKSRAVLKTLFSMHRNWFDANTLEQIQGYTEEVGRGTLDHYDPNEPALTVTLALLDPQTKYSDIVTAPYGIKALRQENTAIASKYGYSPSMSSPMRRSDLRIGPNSPISFRNLADGFAGLASERSVEELIVAPTIQVGDLIGIQPRTEHIFSTNVYLIPLDGNGVINAGHLQPDLNYKNDMYKSYGGGLLGTPVFFMMNYGQPYGLSANGSTKLPRRWVKNAMESLLCSNFPSLRETDIRNFFVGNASAPFRNGKSCLQCHATMDQAATTARNLIVAATDYANLVVPDPNGGPNIDFLNKYPLILVDFKATRAPSSVWSPEPVENFHRQQPTGKIFFRSMNGQLIDRSVNNISELGQSFAETDDFYNCAAKRYFKYFTGIDVAMYDKTNPLNAEINRNLTTSDKEFRNFVESLGAKLKQSQSLVDVITMIMSSKYYQSSDPKSEGP